MDCVPSLVDGPVLWGMWIKFKKGKGEAGLRHDCGGADEDGT